MVKEKLPPQWCESRGQAPEGAFLGHAVNAILSIGVEVEINDKRSRLFFVLSSEQSKIFAVSTIEMQDQVEVIPQIDQGNQYVITNPVVIAAFAEAMEK